MNFFTNSSIGLLALMFAVVASGCHRHHDDDGDYWHVAIHPPTVASTATEEVAATVNGRSNHPTVISTSPATNASDVAVNTSIVARLSQPMLASSINTSTFKLAGPGSTKVDGAVTYDAVNCVATFSPSSALASGTLFTARIGAPARDVIGSPLAPVYHWSFTTGSTADVTPPVVTSTDPANLATNVPINQKITVVFSEQMDSTTLNTTTFTLLDSVNTPVAGSVSCPGSTATFIPLANLAINMIYSAKITMAATDLAGNPLGSDFLWSFETGATAATGPGAVVLGTAGNFVILAKAGVSTTGTTAIVGDLGISPIAATAFTGFALTLDGSGQFATSPFVTGRLYASDYAVPTPVSLTTAVLDMQTAYTDAAGRTLPDFTELGAGNVNGLILVPGLYKWGTGVDCSTGVTIAGGANDVWIFQIAQDLTIGNGAIVTLSGGAQAKNIFWQVAGLATFGTTSDFKGVVLCQTLIALNTGASTNGRLMAQTAVTLDSNVVTQP